MEEESLESLAKEGFTILEFKRLKRDIPSLVEYATSLVGQTISYSTLYSVRDVYWRFRVHIPCDMNEAGMSHFFNEVSESERKPGDLVIGLGECHLKLLGILVSEDQIVWRPERK
ncbi:MAG: hypothetical protein KDK62_08430, partial [Chlamydiia bacterium]|nr:hypothetical protein [Chlamydiia bacterium]